MELVETFESRALVRLFCFCGCFCGWAGDVDEDPVAVGSSWFVGDGDSGLVDAEVLVFVVAWMEAKSEACVGAFVWVDGASIVVGIGPDGVDDVSC